MTQYVSQNPAALLTVTHQEAQAIHSDTGKILGLLTPPQGEDSEDRIAKILEALAEIAESLIALHGKVDALASHPR